MPLYLRPGDILNRLVQNLVLFFMVDETSDDLSLVVCSRSVHSAAAELKEAVEELTSVAEEVQRAGREGAGARDLIRLIIDQGGPPRRRVGRAMAAYEHEVMRLRGELVRVQVDELHMTMTDVARTMGISRTMATRLYRTGGSTTNGSALEPRSSRRNPNY